MNEFTSQALSNLETSIATLNERVEDSLRIKLESQTASDDIFEDMQLAIVELIASASIVYLSIDQLATTLDYNGNIGEVDAAQNS